MWLGTDASRFIYTRNLPEGEGDERRNEIASDFWEYQNCGHESGATPASTAFEILMRLVLGVPADLLWRVQCGFGRPAEERLLPDWCSAKELWSWQNE